MATHSSHRLIMAKVEICIFFCLNGDIWSFFLQKCLLSSPLCFIQLLSKSVYLIGCQGSKKGSIFVKMFKNLLLRNHMEDEVETWHTCLGHYPLQKLCVFFFSVGLELWLLWQLKVSIDL